MLMALFVGMKKSSLKTKKILPRLGRTRNAFGGISCVASSATRSPSNTKTVARSRIGCSYSIDVFSVENAYIWKRTRLREELRRDTRWGMRKTLKVIPCVYIYSLPIEDFPCCSPVQTIVPRDNRKRPAKFSSRLCYLTYKQPDLN